MAFIRKTIQHLASNGCDLIRLDALLMQWRVDTNIGTRYLDLLNKFEISLLSDGTELLPEIREHYSDSV